MYMQKKEMECNKAEPQKICPISEPLKEKRIQDVRYSNVVQRNIVHGPQGFFADKNRIAIDTMPVTSGMDRSHTISDRDVQNAVADWMNAVVNGKANTDAFWNFCVETAGEEAMGTITSCISDLTQILQQKPVDIFQAVTIANQLYVTVANSRFNLRPGNASGNRSTSNCIDLLAPEIVNVSEGGAVIVIKITEVDARPIGAMIGAGRKALVRIKGIGAVASSTNSKYPGSSLSYEIFYMEAAGDGFVYAQARRSE